MDPMIRLAQRVSTEPFFIAYHLAALRREYGQVLASQGAAFGLDPEALAKLARCRMPADASDLEKIAAAFGMEVEALGELLQLDLLL